jgi:hypothetical protein
MKEHKFRSSLTCQKRLAKVRSFGPDEVNGLASVSTADPSNLNTDDDCRTQSMGATDWRIALGRAMANAFEVHLFWESTGSLRSDHQQDALRKQTSRRPYGF